MNETDPRWVKSTRCSSGTCVEVAKVADHYLVRDSKSPENAPLSFTEEEWKAFVEGVQAGEFRF
uniref:Putative regulatory protein n=1 Tax=uncultured bacterium BAC AB649/1850 TaxID=1037453 RepID=F6K0Z7_9BACT|nr:putative regulatory protein [uncultured bacterium BAC AB649/1850]